MDDFDKAAAEGGAFDDLADILEDAAIDAGADRVLFFVQRGTMGYCRVAGEWTLESLAAALADLTVEAFDASADTASDGATQ